VITVLAGLTFDFFFWSLPLTLLDCVYCAWLYFVCSDLSSCLALYCIRPVASR